MALKVTGDCSDLKYAFALGANYIRKTLIIFLIATGYPATSSFGDSSLTKDLFNKLDSENKAIQINSENLAQYEGLLLPHLADFILTFNLQLKVSSLQEPEDKAAPNKEELTEQLASVSLPALTELDIDMSTGTTHSTNQMIIQASAKHLAAAKDPQSGLAFKEKLEVVAPAKLAKLKFLTIRQNGTAEDLLWYFSPSLNKSLELTSSNRADLLFNSLFSLEDIFFLGAKFETLSISDIKTAEFLAPTSSTATSSYQKAIDGKCDSFTSVIKNSADYSLKTTLSRQKIIVVDLKNTDPFSAIGRYRIYFSADNFLPILKEEFSHQGQLRKAALVSMLTSPGNYSVPIAGMLLGGSMAQNKSRKTVFIVSSNGRLCPETPADFKLADLDPSSYWKE